MTTRTTTTWGGLWAPGVRGISTVIRRRSIDGLGPADGFKDERRAVLVDTFDRLAEAAAER